MRDGSEGEGSSPRMQNENTPTGKGGNNMII